MTATASAPDVSKRVVSIAAMHLARRRDEVRLIAAAFKRYAYAGGEIGRLCAFLERGVAEDFEAAIGRQDAELSDLIVEACHPAKPKPQPEPGA